MNFLFLCVSETLYEKIPILDYGEGPLEPYRIVCLCAAKTREQARYDAWKTDRTFDGDVTEMPKFQTRKIGLTILPRKVIEEEYDPDTGELVGPWAQIEEKHWKGIYD